jgi:magnesium chelatase accessory protein
MMSEWDLHRLEPELAALRPPLLLLSGARDGAVQPREILSLRRRLTDVCAIELDACGHLAHEEMPDRVAEAMVQWIDSLDAVGLQGTGPSLGPALPHEVPR